MIGRLTFLALLAAPFLSACVVGPNFKAPPLPPVSTYAAKGDSAPPDDQRMEIGDRIAIDWWNEFHSAALNDVVAMALAGNQTIETARNRVKQAEEDATAAEGALLPQLSLEATAGRQKYGKELFGPIDIVIPPFSYYALGPSLDWQVDLFGGRRRSAEERRAYVQYQKHQLEAAYQSLTADVAIAALTLADSRAQIGILNSIVMDDRRNIDLVRAAIVAGSGTRVQLMSAESQLASDRTLLPDLAQREAVERHALAILIGKAPAEWNPPDFELADFTLPAEIPVTLPSELARRRPDIQAAEAQLHVASAAIGVATANLYPNIDLTGAIPQEALTPGALFNGVSNAWSIAAGITQPIFSGGRLNAERRAAVYNYQATLAIYRETMLNAFGEVSDALQSLSNDATRLRYEMAASNAAARSLDLAKRSYQAGNAGILDVIDAQRRYSAAQLGLARATAERLTDTVRLYLALGDSPMTTSRNPPRAELRGEQSGRSSR